MGKKQNTFDTHQQFSYWALQTALSDSGVGASQTNTRRTITVG